jgi:hypothetical protein
MSQENIEFLWPLPRMFGHEDYAFSYVDLQDKRYRQEAASISQTLGLLLIERQQIEQQWRCAFRIFLEAEKKHANLTNSVLKMSRDEADGECKEAQSKLIRLQSRRDELQTSLRGLWSRCTEIKRSLIREKNLEKLRFSMNERVKHVIDSDDEFWRKKFDVSYVAVAQSS